MLPGRAAEAVTGAATTAAVAGAAASPTSATKAANLQNLVGAIECEFDMEDDSVANAAEVLIPWKLGNSTFGGISGPVVSCSVIVTGYTAGTFALGKWAPQYKRLRLGLALVGTLVVGFFLPSIAGMSSLVMVHADSMTDRFVGFGGAATVAGVFATTLYTINREVLGHVPVGPDGKHRLPGIDTQSFGFRYYYDVARDMDWAWSVHFFHEDLGVALLMAVISSIKLDGIGCSVIAGILALIALLHVAYLVYVRPFRTKVDTALALGVGALQAVVALAVLGATFSKERWLGVVGYTSLALGMMFFVQAIVMMVWTFVLFRRRRNRKHLGKPQGATAGNDAAKPAPAPAWQADTDSAALLLLGDKARESSDSDDFAGKGRGPFDRHAFRAAVASRGRGRTGLAEGRGGAAPPPPP